MKSRNEIIVRIRACLRLADPKSNDNPHEREAANRAAQSLIAKYGITKEELSGKKVIIVDDSRNTMSELFEALIKSGIIRRGWAEGGMNGEWENNSFNSKKVYKEDEDDAEKD